MNINLNKIIQINELDPVALLEDRPDHKLSRGQVGTVVDMVDSDHVLVEFVGADGAAHSIESLPRAILLPLFYEHKAA